MISTASMTATIEGVNGLRGARDRPQGAVRGAERRTVVIAGGLTLALAVVAGATPGWLAAPATPAAQALSGTWSCSVAGETIGQLTVAGWNYVLQANGAGFPQVGSLERVVYGKYREEYVKVQSGSLREQFGVKLGHHSRTDGTLVFSIGPQSGIHCVQL